MQTLTRSEKGSDNNFHFLLTLNSMFYLKNFNPCYKLKIYERVRYSTHFISVFNETEFFLA